MLTHNQLTELPPELAQLPELELLDVQDNQLRSIPPEIRDRPNLALYTDRNPLQDGAP